VIGIRGLRKRFGDRTVLGGIDAEVRAGECIAVVGQSGCGKSTLLRCLNALEPFDAGSIDIAGFALAHGPSHRTSVRALREAVGMVFQ
jgi:polar amino acid transport system ATP-binding protein